MTTTAQMTSLSREVRLSRAWNVLPDLNVNGKFLALGKYWNRDVGAVICIMCKYALQMEDERVSRHLGDKHDIPPTLGEELSACIRYLCVTGCTRGRVANEVLRVLRSEGRRSTEDRRSRRRTLLVV